MRIVHQGKSAGELFARGVQRLLQDAVSESATVTSAGVVHRVSPSPDSVPSDSELHSQCQTHSTDLPPEVCDHGRTEGALSEKAGLTESGKTHGVCRKKTAGMWGRPSHRLVIFKLAHPLGEYCHYLNFNTCIRDSGTLPFLPRTWLSRNRGMAVWTATAIWKKSVVS